MIQKSIGFIGGGRITRIFLAAWTRQGRLPGNMVVADNNPEVLAKLKASYPAIETTAQLSAASAQDLVFLSLHPSVMAEALGSAHVGLKPATLVVSLAPKFTLSKLSSLLGGHARLARVIPNAPSLIGAGFNPVTYAPALTAEDKIDLATLLSPLGESPEVAEEKLEAYAVISAMGPTYLWFQLQNLRELAGRFGLSEAESDTALKRMVCGSTRTLLESGLMPAEVMDLIPVKPLAEMEKSVTEMYQTRLPAIYQKIKP